MMNEDLERGIRLYKEKKYKLALDDFLSRDLDPSENPDLSYYLGLCHTKLNQYDEALLYLEQVVTAHTDLLRIYQSRMVLSYIYSITGRFRLAEFELKQLLESGYESPQVYAAYSYVAYSLKQVKKSIELLEKALEMEEENPTALNSLGYIMAEEETDIPKALDLCSKAAKMKPENPAYLDSLGWAYYKAGRIKEARELLQRAYKLSEGNKLIASHLREVIDKDEGNSDL